MGLKYNALDSQLFVDAIKSNAQQGLEIIGQVDHGNQHLVNSLGNGTGLSGAAYTAGEGLIREIVVPATSQFRSAIEDVLSDVSAYQSAENSVYQYGDLDEDDLEEQINNKKVQKSSFKNQIEYYTEMAYSNPALYDSMMSAARRAQQLLDETERQLNDLQKQLTALQEFEYQTSSLFKDSLTAFSDIVKGISALNGITVDASGYYYTNGADMSWLTKLEDKRFSSHENNEYDFIENNSLDLGLPDDAQKYYDILAKQELKGIPFDEWAKKLDELKQSLYYDNDGNILQILPFNVGDGSGLMVMKNGKYDSELTNLANEEQNTANWQAFKDNSAELLTGLGTALSGVLLGTADFGGTVFSGGSLALVGVSEAVGYVAAGTTVTGAGITADAIRKMGNAPSGQEFSFTNNYVEQKANVGKTSESTVKNVEGKVNGKSTNFRVDVEPDGDKIQVQSGKGKGSIDIRVEPEGVTGDDDSIINQIKGNEYGAKFNKDAMNQLVKGVRKAMDRLK
ncbi:MAG: LXG domain-containing protein [Streptococcaceae bacterium]|jgi:predicted lipoprotein|nr:LXG domain-containing protein [Streptococcaceae bacterium]